MKAPEISVVISTYNSPEWLKKVLYSYQFQTFADFEVVIADDGSNEETKQLIDKFTAQVDFPVKHVWHEDNGFQKTIILNKALVECDADYVLFTDGDCVARYDFLQTHIDHRAKGIFLSGGYFKLPMSISKLITKEDIEKRHCFDIDWLKANGFKSSFKNNKITASGTKAKLLNFFTPTRASWNGHNSSGWKADILAVNGFDERMQYGGEDRELGERLFNLGIKSKQIRYSAICVHLDHARGYVKPEMIQKNLAIRATTKKEKRVWTDYGIKKSAKS
ncbi:glycosyltransferase [Winogradskyella sp. 3972H.M.0a.05]|uniref:glycosyltransferase family 2 protein n=1 Tax=Winogradskyella sp. 3972H.M.0a.05 TaxID=2950277 RepID=UPI00339B5966